MSWKAVDAVLEMHGMTMHEKFVLVVLAKHAHEERLDCFPSISRIMSMSMLSKDSVLRALKGLEAAKLITIDRRRAGKVNLPNVYRLHLNVVAVSDYPVVAASDNGVVAGSDHQSLPASGVVAGGDPNQSLNLSVQEKEQRARTSAFVTFDTDAGEFHGFKGTTRERVAHAFPLVNIDAELSRAAVWRQANPSRCEGDVLAFLTNWMTRADERHRRIAASGPVTGATRHRTVAEKRDEWTDAMFGASRARRDQPTSVVELVDVASH